MVRGSSSEDLRSVKYSFIAISHMTTLTWNGSSCYDSIFCSNKSVWKLFAFKRNTWYNINVNYFYKELLLEDLLLWTPTYGRAKAGRPARTYIQQLCEDTGCSPEDLPEAMNDREKWRERVRDIRVSGTTWWWWWWW